MDEREKILAAVEPAALFGEAAFEPRALRKSYAKLAKQWRSDAEVSAHIRALFERARDGDPGPAPSEDVESEQHFGPIEALRGALTAHQPQGVFDAITSNYRRLITDEPQLFERGLTYLVHGYGESLAPAALDALSRIIEEPLWDPSPQLLRRLRRGIATAGCLWRAKAERALPAPILELLEHSWGQDLVTVGRVWLKAGEALRGVELDEVFAGMERDWPLLMGRLSLLEYRMERLVERVPVDPEDLEEEFFAEHVQLPSLVAVQEDRRLRMIWVGGFGVLYVLYWMTMTYLTGRWWRLPVVQMALIGGFHYWKHRRMSAPVRDPTRVDSFLEFAPDIGIFPGELAAFMVEGLGELGSDNLNDEHPAYQLDRSHSALLRMIAPAHIDRLQRAMEDLNGEARAGD